MEERYYVEVVEDETGEVVRRIGPMRSERKAERVEDGLMRQMDFLRFTTRIVSEDFQG